MRFDLSRFKSGIDRIDRTYEPAAFAGTGDFTVTAPVHLVADVVKDGAKVHLTGRLTATLELACSRCLEPFEVPVDAALDLRYVPAKGPVAPETPVAPPKSNRAAKRAEREAERRKVDAEAELEDDGQGFVTEDAVTEAYYAGDAIDLGEMMREQFYLALPMKPLCGEGCQGLCPVCGRNRNRETCHCESTWVDPRFEALRELKKPL